VGRRRGPDEKKGERLVVLHKLTDEQLKKRLWKSCRKTDLPNLWKPRADQFFFRVESFPMLGTGKLDLRKVEGDGGAVGRWHAPWKPLRPV